MKTLSFSLLCRMRHRELLPLRRLGEFQELLASAPELPQKVLAEKLLSLLPPKERQNARTLALSGLLQRVWDCFFAETVPALPPGALVPGVLSLCREFSWSLEYVLELPYPVFAALLGFDAGETPPGFTAQELSAAEARLLRHHPPGRNALRKQNSTPICKNTIRKKTD